MFTVKQYDQAIEYLKSARQQHLEGTTGNGCGVCGGNCHPDTCGWNPLYAMHLCNEIRKQSSDLHETLHYLSGFNTLMGEPYGPAAVQIPEKGLDNPCQICKQEECNPGETWCAVCEDEHRESVAYEYKQLNGGE